MRNMKISDSMRYAFLTWIEETLKIDVSEWLLEFADSVIWMKKYT